MKVKTGEEFLDNIFSDLHYTKEVLVTAEKSDEPTVKIKKYLDRLEKIINMIIKDESKLHVVKAFFYDKYLSRELPDKFIEIKKKSLGKSELTDDEKKEILESVRNSEKESLDMWLHYLVFSNYPIWFKYYVLRGVLKSGFYDKSIDKITRRTDSTVEPFLELNKDVVSRIYDYLSSDSNDVSDVVSFQKLYIHFLKEVNEKNNDGVWIKFDQNSSPSMLINSIIGKNTGWCSTSMDYAVVQLRTGDFYIYFTKDSAGDYTIPRIAIKMDGHDVVSEIRGVAENQNMEKDMYPILLEKIKNYSCTREYKKIIENYEMLNVIENKINTNHELSDEELCFLYEIGGTLDCFGYLKEKRVNELRAKRQIKQDLNRIFQNVDCKDKCLFLDYLDDASGINFPTECLEIDLSGLKKLDGLVLPNKFKGNIMLNGLETLDGYTFPNEINGSIEFEKLKSLSNVVLPRKVGHDLIFSKLQEFNNVVFPKEVEGKLSLPMIKSIQNMVFPKCHSIGLECAKTLKNVAFPEIIPGNLGLDSLVSCENTIFPKEVDRVLSLTVLQSTVGVELPSEFVGDLDFKFLKDGKNLVLPKKVKRLLVLNLSLDDVIESISNSDVEVVCAEKYYNKESLEKELENYRSKKLII